MKPTPRPHQQAMVDAASAHLRDNDRALVVAACGSGKTLVGCWVADALTARRIVFFAPSLVVLRQAAEAFRAVGREPTCFVASKDLGGALDIDATTDPRDVDAHVQGRREWAIFCTYQSAELVASAIWLSGEPADLLILDEAHRLAGHEGASFVRVLDNDFIGARKRLFMTATPRIVAKRSRDGEPIMQASMDDESLYGREVYRLSFGDAIARGILCDYRVLVVGVPRATADDEDDDAARCVAVARTIAEREMRSVILFHRTKAGATAAVQKISQCIGVLGGGTSSGHTAPRIGTVFGTTSVDDRIQKMKAIAAHGGIAATARALNEGVDFPSVDGIVFMDPKQSVVDIAQAAGRALRLDPASPAKVASIVVPVVVPEGQSAMVAAAGSAWDFRLGYLSNSRFYIQSADRSQNSYVSKPEFLGCESAGKSLSIGQKSFGTRFRSGNRLRIPRSRYTHADFSSKDLPC